MTNVTEMAAIPANELDQLRKAAARAATVNVDALTGTVMAPDLTAIGEVADGDDSKKWTTGDYVAAAIGTAVLAGGAYFIWRGVTGGNASDTASELAAAMFG